MVLVERKPDRPVDAVARRLQIRLAEDVSEIRAAQALRYRVFYEEMDAQPTTEMAALRLDFDSYDDFCDHLLVFDLDRGTGPQAVVGTYRVMRRAAAERRGQFYTTDEYDIKPLLAQPGEILELGRSCVDPDYRNGTSMQLLWRGIAEYVFHYGIDLMFGCGSLHGTKPSELQLPLAFLHQYHLAPPALRPRALESRFVQMEGLPLSPDDVRVARQALPPLIKGYLRLGGFVGDGAVVDKDFGTTDVCIVVKTELITERYFRHYARDESGRIDSDATVGKDEPV